MVALSGYWAAIALKLAVQWRRQAPAWHSRRTAVSSALEDGVRVVDARSVDDFTTRTSARLGQRRIRRPLRRNPLNGRQHWGQDRVDHLPRRGARRRPAAGPRRLRQRRWLSHRGPRRGLPRRATGSAADGAPETSVAELDGRRARRGIALGGHDLRRLEGSNAFQARTVRIYCRGRGANRPQRGGRHPSSPRQPLPYEPVDCRSWPSHPARTPCCEPLWTRRGFGRPPC